MRQCLSHKLLCFCWGLVLVHYNPCEDWAVNSRWHSYVSFQQRLFFQMAHATWNPNISSLAYTKDSIGHKPEESFKKCWLHEYFVYMATKNWKFERSCYPVFSLMRVCFKGGIAPLIDKVCMGEEKKSYSRCQCWELLVVFEIAVARIWNKHNNLGGNVGGMLICQLVLNSWVYSSTWL